MKLVIAIGGNALLQTGQAPTAANLLGNVRTAAAQLAKIANLVEANVPAHQIVLTHGSGPQVGLLALQSAAYAAQNPGSESSPLDMLDAEVAGMLGYVLEQEIANLLHDHRSVATVLTRVEVDRLDAAFKTPTKPIGPTYSREEADKLTAGRPWTMGVVGTGAVGTGAVGTGAVGTGAEKVRRLVASPQPVRVLAMPAIGALLESGALVIAGGGGGIPVMRKLEGAGMEGAGMEGVEAVIDKDLCTALIATGLQADCLIIATDVDAVYVNWGQPDQRRLGQTTPQELAQFNFASGSMGPKVEAAVKFVNATGKRAVIGPLDQIEGMLAGDVGTQITASGGGHKVPPQSDSGY
jgi:carbamate kinase